MDKIIKENDFGPQTAKDVYEALLKDRRDPRDEFEKPLLRSDILKMEDLTEGMILEGTVRNVANRILGIIQIICYVAAIVLLIFLGIKFATASPEGKATVKNSAIIYVVGAVLIFAAGSILGVINKIGTETINAK